MSFSIELLRAYTVPGFHEIKGRDVVTFKAWVTNSKFKISEKKTKTDFTLDVYNKNDLLAALSFDINRMASSSFESLVGISKENNFPRSVGWLIIRLYYAAYFSVHALLRFFGISCTQFDPAQARAIDIVYALYGFDLTSCGTNSAYYSCQYDFNKNKIYGSQLTNTHKDVWGVFYSFLEGLANKIPSSDFLKSDRDAAISFIYGLRNRLSKRNSIASGCWLSQVRNDVNYAHAMGAWFPYSGSTGDHEDMIRLVAAWKAEKSGLHLGSVSEKDSIIFVEACLAVVSLTKELVLDINSIGEKSFLTDGAVKCLNVCRKSNI